MLHAPTDVFPDCANEVKIIAGDYSDLTVPILPRHLSDIDASESNG